MNEQLDLSFDWKFRRGRAGRRWINGTDTAGSETVDLPHCWNSTDSFMEGVDYYRGHGAYLRSFRIPPLLQGAEGDEWVLESEGFYGTGDVWLNGARIADVDGEYLGFKLAVGSHLLAAGANLLAVRLVNNCRSYVLPGIKMPDFLLHGGLAGRMRLVKPAPVHLPRSSLQIVCGDVLGPEPAVSIMCVLRNVSARERRVRTRWTLLSPAGAEVGSAESAELELAPSGACDMTPVEIPVRQPALWSPDSPSLYVARCEVLEGGVVLDRCEQRFGIRSAVFDRGKGFFLNGRRVELRGCNRHESMPGFGSALPECLHREDARLLKETGCNCVRLSHYPQHPAFLDACDELGIMVYAEIATWKSVRTGRWLKRALRQLENMIRRDRNRPGIILWGLGNESRSRPAYIAMDALAKSLDPTRPTIYAENHLRRAKRAGTTGLTDVWGCNYELDVLDEVSGAGRLGVTLVTEISNMPTAVRGNLVEEMKQVELIESDLALLEGKGFNAGWLIWCMTDYATLRKKRYMRYCGVWDAWRMPKMSRALLQAKCLTVPFVRLFADWGSAQAPGAARSGLREVHVFTNCERVALFRNGREILSAQGRQHMVLRVEFEPGVLEARGWNGVDQISDGIESFGSARSLIVRPENERMVAATRGTTGVRISAVDERGVLCRDWQGEAVVEVTGVARSRVYTPGGMIPLWGGEGRTFITGCGQVGTSVVRAVCPPLCGGTSEVVFA